MQGSQSCLKAFNRPGLMIDRIFYNCQTARPWWFLVLQGICVSMISVFLLALIFLDLAVGFETS